MNSSKKLRIGTRGSRLALHQTHTLEKQLKTAHPELETEIVVIKTQGDISSKPFEQLDGIGLFTRELDAALVNNKIDAGVHSLKDLPTLMRDGILLGAITVREDAHEAFVSINHKCFALLPQNAVVGTGSPRRKAQLLALRPDLKVVNFRGNVETRLRKMEEGQADATLLACAGLNRLDLQDKITERLSLEVFTPSPGQGALGVTVRRDDPWAAQTVSCLIDPVTAQAVTAERTFLLKLGGGCKTPIACHARVKGERLEAMGFVASPDGKTVIQDKLSGDLNSGQELGERLAKAFLSQGARDLI